MIGKRIGERYELLQVIGEGGMSRVYLAKDIILDREVAIKILHYDFAHEDDLKKRFQREALSATSLTHPNIVDIYDVGEDGELHYLVMEYINGQTLKTYIQQKGRLTADEAVPIMKQLVSAISHAHHSGIIHRDIKPQNILMDAEGEVKITDFGIAMALNATAYTKTNSIIGTVHYLSPEQARGGIASKRSDLYSLGIVFYELLTGELPFAAESAVAIALKHLQEEIPSVRARFPDIPQSVENVILKSTAKNSNDRYLSADDMYEDLSTVLDASRLNEPKYEVMIDDDATKVMPAIKNIPIDPLDERTKVLATSQEPKEETTAVKPLPTKKKKKKWMWPVIGFSAILLALILYLVLSNKDIAVPDVTGLEKEDAIEQLEKLGFILDEVTEEHSDDVEENRVIQTIPKADAKRAKGSKITLFVSLGSEKEQFGNYVGRKYEDITSMLTDYKKVRSEEKHSDAPAGEIIEQNIEPGEEVIPSETEVLFTISAGVEFVKVENLSNYTNEQLIQYAKESGFNIIKSREEHSLNVEEGKVISQKPAPQSEAKKGSDIHVVISKGPPEKKAKLLIRTVTIPYDEEAEGETQSIKIYIQDKSHSMTDPIEEFTITETVKKRITIELEEGMRGGYRIMKDATVIEEEMFDYNDVK